MKTEEIRAMSENLEPYSDYWQGYIDGLKRVLEDPDPKPIERIRGEGLIPDKFNEIIDRLNKMVVERRK